MDLSLCTGLNETFDNTVVLAKDIQPSHYNIWDTDLTGALRRSPPTYARACTRVLLACLPISLTPFNVPASRLPRQWARIR